MTLTFHPRFPVRLVSLAVAPHTAGRRSERNVRFNQTIPHKWLHWLQQQAWTYPYICIFYPEMLGVLPDIDK